MGTESQEGFSEEVVHEVSRRGEPGFWGRRETAPAGGSSLQRLEVEQRPVSGEKEEPGDISGPELRPDQPGDWLVCGLGSRGHKGTEAGEGRWPGLPPRPGEAAWPCGLTH